MDTAGLSAADLRHWHWHQFEAVGGLRAAGIEPETGMTLAVPSQLMLRGNRLAGRIRAGLARRLGGSSFPVAFGPGPLDAHHGELLKAIGYAPVRVSHSELEGD